MSEALGGVESLSEGGESFDVAPVRVVDKAIW